MSALPLHHYLRQFGSRLKASSLNDGVDKILAEHPDSIRAADDDAESSLPLHCALEEIRHSEDDDGLQVTQRLVEAYPESVRMTDIEHKLPIHYACENLQSISVLRYLLDRYPESIQAKDVEGFTPLHYVCYGFSLLSPSDTTTIDQEQERELDVIDFLLANTPPAVRFDDFLLRIVPYQRPKQVERIALQTEGVPDALRKPDLLLHALCHIPSAGTAFFWFLRLIYNNTRQQNEQQVSDSLLDARDEEGNSILHTLVSSKGFTTVHAETSRTLSEDVDEHWMYSVLKWICKLRPSLVSSCNNAGDTVLHLACRSHCSVYILDLLLQKMEPNVIDRRNKLGQLPIHLLVASSTTTRPNKKRKTSGSYVMEATRALVYFSKLPLLAVADPMTGLVPFLAAAAAGNDDDDHDHDTATVELVSTLLREDPSPLMTMVTTTTRKRKRR